LPISSASRDEHSVFGISLTVADGELPAELDAAELLGRQN